MLEGCLRPAHDSGVAVLPIEKENLQLRKIHPEHGLVKGWGGQETSQEAVELG